MLRLQLGLDLFPFPFLILEKDPGGHDGTEIDEKTTHENTFNIPRDS